MVLNISEFKVVESSIEDMEKQLVHRDTYVELEHDGISYAV